MPDATKHRRLVEEVATEFGATVTQSGGDHLRVTGRTGWFVTLPKTPKSNWSLARIRNRINTDMFKLAAKKAGRIGKSK